MMASQTSSGVSLMRSIWPCAPPLKAKFTRAFVQLRKSKLRLPTTFSEMIAKTPLLQDARRELDTSFFAVCPATALEQWLASLG
jgi:hypothetical protein